MKVHYCQVRGVWFAAGSVTTTGARAEVYKATKGARLAAPLVRFSTEVHAILACGLENLKKIPKRRIINISSDNRITKLVMKLVS